MAVVSAALNPPTTECKPFSSVAEFQQNYSISVDKGIINIAEKVTSLLVAAWQTQKEGDQHRSDTENPSHVYRGIYYFVLSSTKYRAKHVYSFDPGNKSIKYLIASLRSPQFFENLLVEFGTGFARPGLQEVFYDGRGIIMIYDLTPAQGAREVRKHILNADARIGWDGSIDEKSQEICAFNLETHEERKFPFSDLLK